MSMMILAVIDEERSPRGVRGFMLNTGEFGEWKVQGKIGGYTKCVFLFPVRPFGRLMMRQLSRQGARGAERRRPLW